MVYRADASVHVGEDVAMLQINMQLKVHGDVHIRAS